MRTRLLQLATTVPTVPTVPILSFLLLQEHPAQVTRPVPVQVEKDPGHLPDLLLAGYVKQLKPRRRRTRKRDLGSSKEAGKVDAGDADGVGWIDGEYGGEEAG